MNPALCTGISFANSRICFSVGALYLCARWLVPSSIPDVAKTIFAHI